MPRDKPNTRPDHTGTHRSQFESNKRKIDISKTSIVLALVFSRCLWYNIDWKL